MHLNKLRDDFDKCFYFQSGGFKTLGYEVLKVFRNLLF